MTKTPDEIEFEQHLRILDQAKARMEIDMHAGDVICVVAQLQLALRRPGNNRYSAGRARFVCDTLIALLDKASPGLGALMRRGFDPLFDVPNGKDGN